MNLLELLVKELPKLGGWPSDRTVASNGINGTVTFHSKGRAPFVMAGLNFSGTGCVSFEEYEAALAASRPSEWDGEGLPPVGCECEAKMPGVLGEPWCWRRVKVAISGMVKAENECLVYDVESTRPAWTDEFRPIRTEAERKRDGAILAMRESLGHAAGLIEVGNIYRAIAAGKIPGIRLTDDAGN